MKYLLERKNYGELYHVSSLINIYGIVNYPPTPKAIDGLRVSSKVLPK